MRSVESEISNMFLYFLAAGAAKKCKKNVVIKSAASAASAKGGCASSRLDHGLKFYVNRGGCASSRLISGFSDCVLSFQGRGRKTDCPAWCDFVLC